MAQRPRLALFEFAHFGHRPHHLRLLIEAWKQRNGEDALAIVVTPRFAAAHGDVLALAAEKTGAPVNSVIISDQEDRELAAAQTRTAVRIEDFAKARLADDDWSRQHWSLFNSHAARLEPQHSLMMYLDAYLLPMAMGLPAVGHFSGIFFRPSYHYASEAGVAEAAGEKLQRLQERFLVARMLKHPKLARVFCLDPTYVAQHQPGRGAEVVWLPDPVKLPSTAAPAEGEARLREDLAIESGRKTFLFFGALDDRKGTWQLLAALERLPNAACRRLCLLLVGTLTDGQEQLIRDRIAALTEAKPLQFVTRFHFVPDEEMCAYFRAADVVLAVYQRHVGMSGISVLAAAFQKPLLTQSYGVVGALTREHCLGLTVDTTDPDAIAAGIQTLLNENPEKICDRARMRAFAESNAVEHFAATIFNHLP